MSLNHTITGNVNPIDITVNNLTILGTQTGGGAEPTTTSFTNQMSGPWGEGTELNVTVYLTRIGPIVFMTITGDLLAAATTGTYITFLLQVPPLYRPAEYTYCPAVIVNNTVQSPGTFGIDTNGAMYVETLQNNGNFVGAGVAGLYASTASWYATVF